MVIETTMKYILRRLDEAFQEYARRNGWGPGDYQVFVRLNLDWLAIHVFLVAKTFPEQDEMKAWIAVHAFLKDQLRDDPSLFGMIKFIVCTYDQVAPGGLYSIPPRYADLNDLLCGAVTPEPGESFQHSS